MGRRILPRHIRRLPHTLLLLLQYNSQRFLRRYQYLIPVVKIESCSNHLPATTGGRWIRWRQRRLVDQGSKPIATGSMRPKRRHQGRAMRQSEASIYGPCHHRSSSIKGNTMATGLPMAGLFECFECGLVGWSATLVVGLGVAVAGR